MSWSCKSCGNAHGYISESCDGLDSSGNFVVVEVIKCVKCGLEDEHRTNYGPCNQDSMMDALLS